MLLYYKFIRVKYYKLLSLITVSDSVWEKGPCHAFLLLLLFVSMGRLNNLAMSC